MPNTNDMASPRMLVSIMTTADADKLQRSILAEDEIPIVYQCRGKGTAPSEMLDIFGLGGTTRYLTLALMPKRAVHRIFESMAEKLSFRKRGCGVSFSVPLNGMQSTTLNVLQSYHGDDINNSEGEGKAMAENEKKTEYAMILVSVESGGSDDVVEAAREAGARGGTVLRGLRHVSDYAKEHMGISLQEEQEFVMMVVKKEKKAEIMRAISDKCGLRTGAHGIVMSLPVDEVLGLEG